MAALLLAIGIEWRTLFMSEGSRVSRALTNVGRKERQRDLTDALPSASEGCAQAHCGITPDRIIGAADAVGAWEEGRRLVEQIVDL